MEAVAKIRCVDLQSAFLPSSAPLGARQARESSRVSLPGLRTRRFRTCMMRSGGGSKKGGNFARFPAAAVGTAVAEAEEAIDIESVFSELANGATTKKQLKKKPSGGGASSVSSGIRLENVSKSYKGVTVLKDVSWEVKKGEKAGLVGVNGAGKTTQLRIIAGLEEADSGNVVKAKDNMKVAFLSQEFEVCQSRTVKEEFQSAFKEEMEIAERLEKVQKVLENSVEDLTLMGRLLDELDLLQRRAQDVDLDVVDVKINKLMLELGFSTDDSDRLIASFSGGWQMRMCLGKILLQEPDLLLLDEPTNHLDLDTIEWLEKYLGRQDVPMVIISHDRAFLDQLCTKIVETDMGVSRTFMGNYSQYILSKATWIESQYAAWEKQQKEIEHTKDLISRLGAGANSGRASTEEKKLEKLQEEGQVEKPFQRKQMKIRFPERGRSGRSVAMIKNLEFGYGDQARLAFCKFMVKPSTLLVLDEPTNHLDIPSKEMLEEAISEYKGTIIAVSHDRYFIRQIVNRVVEVNDGCLQDYAGDYNYYLEKNLDARQRELEREAELEEKAPKVKAKSKMAKEEKEARKKQKMQAFQQAKAKSKGLKNAKRWN